MAANMASWIAFFDLIAVSIVVKIANVESQEFIWFEIFPIANVLILSTFVAITLRINVTVILVSIIFICILVITFLLPAFAWNNEKAVLNKAKQHHHCKENLSPREPNCLMKCWLCHDKDLQVHLRIYFYWQTKHKHCLTTSWFRLWVSYYLQWVVYTHTRLYSRSIDLKWR